MFTNKNRIIILTKIIIFINKMIYSHIFIAPSLSAVINFLSFNSYTRLILCAIAFSIISMHSLFPKSQNLISLSSDTLTNTFSFCIKIILFTLCICPFKVNEHSFIKISHIFIIQRPGDVNDLHFRMLQQICSPLHFYRIHIIHKVYPDLCGKHGAEIRTVNVQLLRDRLLFQVTLRTIQDIEQDIIQSFPMSRIQFRKLTEKRIKIVYTFLYVFFILPEIAPLQQMILFQKIKVKPLIAIKKLRDHAVHDPFQIGKCFRKIHIF